jgi:hypothetical protein
MVDTDPARTIAVARYNCVPKARQLEFAPLEGRCWYWIGRGEANRQDWTAARKAFEKSLYLGVEWCGVEPARVGKDAAYHLECAKRQEKRVEKSKVGTLVMETREELNALKAMDKIIGDEIPGHVNPEWLSLEFEDVMRRHAQSDKLTNEGSRRSRSRSQNRWSFVKPRRSPSPKVIPQKISELWEYLSGASGTPIDSEFSDVDTDDLREELEEYGELPEGVRFSHFADEDVYHSLDDSLEGSNPEISEDDFSLAPTAFPVPSEVPTYEHPITMAMSSAVSGASKDTGSSPSVKASIYRGHTTVNASTARSGASHATDSTPLAPRSLASSGAVELHFDDYILVDRASTPSRLPSTEERSDSVSATGVPTGGDEQTQKSPLNHIKGTSTSESEVGDLDYWRNYNSKRTKPASSKQSTPKENGSDHGKDENAESALLTRYKPSPPEDEIHESQRNEITEPVTPAVSEELSLSQPPKTDIWMELADQRPEQQDEAEPFDVDIWLELAAEESLWEHRDTSADVVSVKSAPNSATWRSRIPRPREVVRMADFWKKLHTQQIRDLVELYKSHGDVLKKEHLEKMRITEMMMNKQGWTRLEQGRRMGKLTDEDYQFCVDNLEDLNWVADSLAKDTQGGSWAEKRERALARPRPIGHHPPGANLHRTWTGPRGMQEIQSETPELSPSQISPGEAHPGAIRRVLNRFNTTFTRNRAGTTSIIDAPPHIAHPVVEEQRPPRSPTRHHNWTSRPGKKLYKLGRSKTSHGP